MKYLDGQSDNLIRFGFSARLKVQTEIQFDRICWLMSGSQNPVDQNSCTNDALSCINMSNLTTDGLITELVIDAEESPFLGGGPPVHCALCSVWCNVFSTV